MSCHGGGKRKKCVAAGNLSVQLSTTMFLSGVLDHPHCSGLSTPAISTMMHWKLQTFAPGPDQGGSTYASTATLTDRKQYNAAVISSPIHFVRPGPASSTRQAAYRYAYAISALRNVLCARRYCLKNCRVPLFTHTTALISPCH